MNNPVIEEIQRSILRLVGQSVEHLPAVLVAIAIVLGTRYAVRITLPLLHRLTEQFIVSVSLRLLAQQVARVAIWTLGIVIAAVAAFPDLQLGDIIGFLGLGSVAIGFAFQDIFKNFLAGILLLLQEPFRIGDQVIISDFEGTVESIAIRSTQLLTYQGVRVDIPNALIFTSPVKVLTAQSHRRTDLDIGVDYTTPLPIARQTLLTALEGIEGIVSIPAPEVDLVSFGDSSINLKVRYWTLPQMAHVRRIQSEVILALKAACDTASITIPYPIRTVHWFDQAQFDESTLNAAKL